MRHKVSFKQSLINLNTDLSFSWTGCLTKVKESSLPYYLPIAWENLWIHTFPREYHRYVKCKQFRPGFELVSPCQFPTTEAITPRTFPTHSCMVSCILIQS